MKNGPYVSLLHRLQVNGCGDDYVTSVSGVTPIPDAPGKAPPLWLRVKSGGAAGHHLMTAGPSTAKETAQCWHGRRGGDTVRF